MMPLEEEHRSWRNPNGVKGASLEAHGQEYAYQGRRCMFDPLGWEDPLEKEMATHSTILSWETPWSEEPGRLQSMGSKRVRHSLVSKRQQWGENRGSMTVVFAFIETTVR